MEKMNKKVGLSTPLASEESTRISLECIRNHQAGLNQHRLSMLNRVPDRESWCSFKLNVVEYSDLAYLSAATGDEFALLRGKNEDILYHGTKYHCPLEKSDTLMGLLLTNKLSLEVHTHPDRGRIIPSADDRSFLRYIGQKSSKIISSYTGKIMVFHANLGEDI